MVRADPALRRQALLLILGGLVAWSMVIAFGLSLLAAFSGFTVMGVGRSAAAARRFPPEGLRVLRDTRVVEGRRAVLLGRTYLLVGALELACAAARLALGTFVVVALWP